MNRLHSAGCLSLMAAALLSGCAYSAKVPDQMKGAPDRPLLTTAAAVVVTCAAARTTWDVQFGSKAGKYLCLVPAKAGPSGNQELRAEIPAGTECRITKATFWSGGDADGYIFDAIVPSFSRTQMVLINSYDTLQIFNVKSDSR